MCGIIGYVGHRDAVPILLEGLRRLEYRGYDSAGVALRNGTDLNIRKKSGRIAALDDALRDDPLHGTLGIGHTRWATHGPATDENAHPHLGGDGSVAVIHNGVIENYARLRDLLIGRGYEFHTQTDTEVVAHLIAFKLAGLVDAGRDSADVETCTEAIAAATAECDGAYGLGVLFRDLPDTLFAVRNGSPLVVGVGKGEHFIASDAGPLAGHTDDVVYLDDREMAVLTADRFRLLDRGGVARKPVVQKLEALETDDGLGDYPHYMLKEIFEQPRTIENAMRGRIDRDAATAKFGGLNLSSQELRKIDRIVLTACGTSWHAALVGEYLIEEFARIPVEVEYASELRYRNPPIKPNTMVFALTQSGETADTLAALRECKRKGQPSLSICNVVGSTIAREADGGIYLHAGPEIGVASTKAFTSQVTVLTLLALFLGRMRHVSYPSGQRLLTQLEEIPGKVEQTLKVNDQVKEIAAKYATCRNFLYLGRLYNFPIALEGALKLKEISYVHAEGYPAAEMKHGPIALIEQETPSVFIVPRGNIYPKVVSNIEEVKARGGSVIAIACEDDERIKALADDVICVPDVEEYLQPLVCSIPLQLLAYHIALMKGCDVDRPRNLAKSVTVE